MLRARPCPRWRVPLRRSGARTPSCLRRSASEDRYRKEARIRAHAYTGYRHVEGCSSCDVREICDGFYADYVELFGAGEARPIQLGGPVTDPQHFSRHQAKRVHPADLAWLE